MISALTKAHARCLADQAADVACGLAKMGMVNECALLLALAQVAVVLADDKAELASPPAPTGGE